MSLVESSTNIAIGYLVSVTANALILPLFGLYPSLYDNFLIGAAFTAVSFVRSYCLRRWFNWKANGKGLAARHHTESE